MIYKYCKVCFTYIFLFTQFSVYSQIVTNPHDTTICEFSEVSFWITANDALRFQWQIRPNGSMTWLNVINDENYSGAQTDLLTIINTPQSFNLNFYRCIATFQFNQKDTSNSAKLTILVKPSIPGNITGLNDVCQGQSNVAYETLAIPFADTFLWEYTGSGVTINGNGNDNITIDFQNNSTTGNLIVTGQNICGDGPISPNFHITVNYIPGNAGSISGAPEICQGQNNCYYNVQEIEHATSYLWDYSGQGADIIGNGNSIIINFLNSATSGNLTVQGHDTCGNGNISPNFFINVNPLPSAAENISGSSIVCQEQINISYFIPEIANATSYIWHYSGLGADIIGNGNSIIINFLNSATSGNLNVQGNNSCGNGNISQNFFISVNPLPSAAENISGSSIVCQGQMGIVYAISNIPNAISYTWSYSGEGVIINNDENNIINIDFLNTATSGYLTVQGHNDCGNGNVSSEFYITVNSLPLVAGNISGDSIICQGQTKVKYSVPSIIYANSYLWDYTGLSAFINGNNNSVEIDFSNAATSGFLTVKGTNDCGDGLVSSDFYIDVKNLPDSAGPISGPDIVCQNQKNVSFSIPIINGATDYLWTLPEGTTIISGSHTNLILVDFLDFAKTGLLEVNGSNVCGKGLSSKLNIIVNLSPGNAGSIYGPDTICAGDSSVNFYINPISNANLYSWEYSGNEALLNFTENYATLDFSNSATSGFLSVNGSNECGYSNYSQLFINVIQIPNPVILGNSNVCKNEYWVKYYTEPSEDFNYWEVINGSIMTGQGTNEIFIHWGFEDTGIVKLTKKSVFNLCTGTTEFFVTAKPNNSPDTISIYVLNNDLNTGILYCFDNYNYYIWGYENKNTFQEIIVSAGYNFSDFNSIDTDKFNYWVKISNDNQCETKCYFNKPSILFIESEQSNTINLRVYPNPFRENLTIEINSKENGEFEIYLQNYIGNEVLYYKNQQSNFIIKCTTDFLKSGMYILIIKNKKMRIFNKKLIKIK
jgi:hypothetical protein